MIDDTKSNIHQKDIFLQHGLSQSKSLTNTLQLKVVSVCCRMLEVSHLLRALVSSIRLTATLISSRLKSSMTHSPTSRTKESFRLKMITGPITFCRWYSRRIGLSTRISWTIATLVVVEALTLKLCVCVCNDQNLQLSIVCICLYDVYSSICIVMYVYICAKIEWATKGSCLFVKKANEFQMVPLTDIVWFSSGFKRHRSTTRLVVNEWVWWWHVVHQTLSICVLLIMNDLMMESTYVHLIWTITMRMFPSIIQCQETGSNGQNRQIGDHEHDQADGYRWNSVVVFGCNHY